MQTLHIKILSIRSAERYVVRRLVLVAELDTRPGVDLEIAESGDPTEIGRYATALVQPSLVIEGRTVCNGRMPARAEVAAWLRQAVEGEPPRP